MVYWRNGLGSYCLIPVVQGKEQRNMCFQLLLYQKLVSRFSMSTDADLGRKADNEQAQQNLLKRTEGSKEL